MVARIGALNVRATEVGELHILTSPTYLYFEMMNKYFQSVSNLTLEVPALDTRRKILPEPVPGRRRLAPPSFCPSEIMKLRHNSVHWLSDHVDHVHLNKTYWHRNTPRPCSVRRCMKGIFLVTLSITSWHKWTSWLRTEAASNLKHSTPHFSTRFVAPRYPEYCSDRKCRNVCQRHILRSVWSILKIKTSLLTDARPD